MSAALECNPARDAMSAEVSERSQGASLLLTGGTGFLGRALLRQWSDEFNRAGLAPKVTVLSRRPDSFQAQFPEFQNLPWLRFHIGDILSPESFPKGCHFTHILHAAADSTLGPELRPLQRHEQIVTGTRNMLEFAVAKGVHRFLLMSSGGAYGPQPSDMTKIPENYNGMPDPLASANSYGVAKRMAEHLCALYRDTYGVEVVIARCFSFVGQDIPLDAHFAIGNFIRDALQGKEIVIKGNGSPIRSYLDQRDCAVWLRRILHSAPSGGVYNVGSDMPISILDLAMRVRDLLASEKKMTISRGGGDSIDRNVYVPDITRARRELRLDVWTTLDDAIQYAGRHALAEERVKI